MDDFEPIAERLIRVLEDGSDQNREAIAFGSTLRALPMPFARGEVIDLGIAATGAVDAIRPTPSLQIGFAGIFVREQVVEFGGGKLVNGLGAFSHRSLPSVEGIYHV